VFEAVCALARLEGLPVRNAGGGMAQGLAARSVRTTDWFEEGFFDQGVSISHLVSIIQSLPEGSTEMMCHPAHEDAELAASSAYATVRVFELQALCDPAVRTAIEAAGIELISYSDL
jgi:predicted glycoside hydrolase/deacetylase ChbG (UPF0249 family)